MKVRNGFVSNSSSSSFIIGYGVINDMDAFKGYCKKNNIIYTEYEDDKYCDDITLFDYIPNNQRIISASNNQELIVPKDVAQDYTPKVVVRISNDEGDYAFSVYDNHDNWVDYDYDKAKKISYYPEDQQAIINMFSKPFIKGEVKYGAERNG